MYPDTGGWPTYPLALLLRVPRPCAFCKGGVFDVASSRQTGHGRSVVPIMREEIWNPKMKAQEEFWKWFTQHEAELHDFDPGQDTEREKIFNKLAAQLQKVDPDLTFEFGPTEPGREFVISAGGMKRAFPAVASLVNAAPSRQVATDRVSSTSHAFQYCAVSR
jgi:hypothetical protein